MNAARRRSGQQNARMSDTEPVRYEERDDIAIITLNRPDKKNTLTNAVIQGVADGIDAAAASRDVCLLYTSPSPRDLSTSRMPSSA